MTGPVTPTLPSKALPLWEAMETFLPKELWAEYAGAIEVLREKKRPARPDYFLMGRREWEEAMESYEVAMRPAREAKADLDRLWAQMMHAMVEQLIEGSLIAFAQPNLRSVAADSGSGLAQPQDQGRAARPRHRTERRSHRPARDDGRQERRARHEHRHAGPTQ